MIHDSKTEQIFISLRQSPPQSHAPHPNGKSLAAAFYLGTHETGLVDALELQLQVMATSTTRHLIVPITTFEALNPAVVDRNKLLEQLAVVDDKPYGLFLFTRQDGKPERVSGSTFHSWYER